MSFRRMITEAVPSIIPRLRDFKARVSFGIANRIGLTGDADSSRISDDYVPIAAYLFESLNKSPNRPFIVGISAPQGCGKTTLTEALHESFTILGRTCVSISLDDFYLTGAEQDELADKYFDNYILQSRGNGTKIDYKGIFDFHNVTDVSWYS